MHLVKRAREVGRPFWDPRRLPRRAPLPDWRAAAYWSQFGVEHGLAVYRLVRPSWSAALAAMALSPPSTSADAERVWPTTGARP